MMKKYSVIILLVLMLLICRSAFAQKELYSDLERARKAVNNGNYAKAQELFEQLEKSMEGLPLPVQEMIQWESADLSSRRGRNAVSDSEKFYFYNLAVTKWGTYLYWFFELSATQIEELKKSGIDRTGRAIHNLAVAYVDRGNRKVEGMQCGGIYEMFAALNQYQAEFFIPDTIDWWKIWLMKYSNDWQETSGKSYKMIAQNCFKNQHDCFEMWIEFKDFMKQCISENTRLQPVKKTRMNMEIAFIESIN